jgi:hypothetical protein
LLSPNNVVRIVESASKMSPAVHAFETRYALLVLCATALTFRHTSGEEDYDGV